MNKKISFLSAKKIHFIGICGVSMSGLARYLLTCGKAVSGSDNHLGETSKQLESLGAKIFKGHSSSNINGADLVVVTSAIGDDNPELKFALESGISVIKRSELLGEIIKNYKKSIAVSGSHGKTTTTAMILHVLNHAEKDPTAFVGGDDCTFGNFRQGSDDCVVVEACEYKKNLLDIKADVSVVLNIDNDHGDSYVDMDDMVETFRKFSENTLLIINADDVFVDKIYNSTTLTFGIEKTANYYAKNIKKGKVGYSFTAYAYSMPCGKIELNIPGKHNVYNALAAFAVGNALGIPFGKIKHALENFSSVKRRSEYLGELFGLKAYADYAHHPREITAMLSAFSEEQDDFIVVFQPHTYSRTKYLKQDFVNALSQCENLIIYKTYAAREDFDEEGSAISLCNAIKKVNKKGPYYAEKPEQLKILLKKFSKGKSKVIFLGAGDIYEVAKQIIEEYLSAKKH